MSDAAANSPELPDDIGALKSMIGEKTAELRTMELRIAVLEEQLRLAAHKRFGARSEKADPAQPVLPELFNEAESLAGASDAGDTAASDGQITVPAHTRKTGGRKPFPDHLPRERVEHDIAEAEKLCPCGSGHARPRIGEVVSEQSDIEPAKIKIIENVRFKYGSCHVCDGVFPEAGGGMQNDTAAIAATTPAPAEPAPTGATPTPRTIVVPAARPIIVAPMPLQPIPKSMATAGMCAFIAIMKYADGLPLYRQEKILARYGLTIPRATLASWMIKLGALIVPLMNLLHEAQVSYDVMQMDETTVQVLKEDGRAAQTKSRMWVRRGGPPQQPVILFDYEPTRAGAVAWRLLEDFKGFLQSDGYSGYIAVGKRDGIVHLGCLAHARRKFDEALKAQKQHGRGGLAAEGLALIQRIYRIEKLARAMQLTPEQRKALRNEKARPIWDELRKWLDAKRGHAPPQTLVGQAMTFLDNQWSLLIRVLDDGRLEVDNNLCENAIRPFVMGRKAWLFSDTPAGAEASARLYSLIETSKACGLEPYAYLKRVFTDLPRATMLAEIEALLPWNVAQPATRSVAA